MIYYVVASAMNENRTIGWKTKHEMSGGVHVGGATVFVAGLMIREEDMLRVGSG